MGRVRGAVGVSLIEVMARCQSRGRSGLQPFTKSGLQTCLSESLTNPCNFLGMEIRNGLFLQAKKKKGGRGWILKAWTLCQLKWENQERGRNMNFPFKLLFTQEPSCMLGCGHIP